MLTLCSLYLQLRALSCDHPRLGCRATDVMSSWLSLRPESDLLPVSVFSPQPLLPQAAPLPGAAWSPPHPTHLNQPPSKLPSPCALCLSPFKAARLPKVNLLSLSDTQGQGSPCEESPGFPSSCPHLKGSRSKLPPLQPQAKALLCTAEPAPVQSGVQGETRYLQSGRESSTKTLRVLHQELLGDTPSEAHCLPTVTPPPDLTGN